jgi:hypothetical protein
MWSGPKSMGAASAARHDTGPRLVAKNRGFRLFDNPARFTDEALNKIKFLQSQSLPLRQLLASTATEVVSQYMA